MQGDISTGSRIAHYERYALAAIIVLSVILAVAYARFVPWGEAPDETAHERYVEYVVRFARLPPITANHPYTNESQQPPLYYVLAALAVWTTRLAPGAEPLDAPLRANMGFNDDVNNPAKQPVYNVLKHDPASRFPPYGYLLRGVSILLGVVTILFVYAAARRLTPPPRPPTVALAAASIAALQPQRLFIGMSATNENLSTLFSAWLCFLLVSHLQDSSRAPADNSQLMPQDSKLVTGAVLGLGVLSKYTVASLAVPLLWVFWIARRGAVRGFVRDAAVMLGGAALVAGPFLIYNTVAYGDPVASRAVAAMLPNDSTYRITDLFWLQEPFRGFLWTSYWGVFGWQRIWMPGWFYAVFALLTLAGMLGGVRLVVSGALAGWQRATCGALLGHALVVYAAVVLYSLRVVAWQGRELFPALPGLSILLGLGLVGLVSGRRATGAEITSSDTHDPAWVDGILLAAVPGVLLFANIAALLRLREIFEPLWR